jgi:hypothetical protein
MNYALIDTTLCSETVHEFRREGYVLTPYHMDGKECEIIEYSFKYDPPLNLEKAVTA